MSYKTNEDCVLCCAINNSGSACPEIFNTPIFESQHFKILPAKGPLVVGHAMIVSKRHFLSLSQMISSFSEDFDYVINRIISIDKSVLFSEHGAGIFETGATCVSHTHIHIFPESAQFLDLLSDSLTTFLEGDIKSWGFLEAVDFPYILNFNSTGKYVLYNGYNVHSQMMRRRLYLRFGGSPDWRNVKEIDTTIKTVDLWREKL